MSRHHKILLSLQLLIATLALVMVATGLSAKWTWSEAPDSHEISPVAKLDNALVGKIGGIYDYEQHRETISAFQSAHERGDVLFSSLQAASALLLNIGVVLVIASLLCVVVLWKKPRPFHPSTISAMNPDHPRMPESR